MPRNEYWQEPDIAVPWEALPEPDKYRGGCSQPTIWLSMGTPIKELEKGLKDLKGFATRTTVSINQTSPTSSQGLKHQPKSIHGETHDYSRICSRGWPCQGSVVEVALGPVMARWPRKRNARARRWELMGWWGNTLIEAGGLGGENEKGDNIWNVNK